MFKPGDVVMQEKTMVNKLNFKDNKQNRLSIVLFSYEENDKIYYATVPVTNASRGTYNKIISKNHLYMPYSILNDTKFCCAKIDSIYLYDENNLKKADISINERTLMLLFKKILTIEVEDYQKELYDFIKIMINDHMDRCASKEKQEKKKILKERKAKRKILKQTYKNNK